MLELLSRIVSALAPSIVQSITGRSRLKIICFWTNQINGDGVGTFLALGVKIINPTTSSIYFERLEAVDLAGKSFYPSLFGVKVGDEIPPQRNIVGIIPCGHATQKSLPKELRIFDSTERKYTLKGKTLKNVVEQLDAERTRLEHLNLAVHPTSPHPG